MALHPVLLAAAPVLVVWATNVEEVAADQTLGAFLLAGAILAVTGVLGLAVTRDVRRAALCASVVTALVLVHTYLWGFGTLSRVVGVPVLLGVAVLVARTSRDLDEDALGRMTLVANLVSLLAVGVALAPIVSASLASRTTTGMS